MSSAKKIAIPQQSLIVRALPRIDYADAYRVALPPHAPDELEPLVRAIFGNPPGWARLLMGMRDRVKPCASRAALAESRELYASAPLVAGFYPADRVWAAGPNLLAAQGAVIANYLPRLRGADQLWHPPGSGQCAAQP